MQKPTLGFTLVEMVMVIVLLGIVSIGIGGLVRIGSQAYIDVSNRDELISSARFAVERLNRELRAALPNSARLHDNGNPTNFVQCLEFIPSIESTVYTDIPVFPDDATDTITVIRFDDTDFNNTLRAAVYPINADSLYGVSDRIFDIDSMPSTVGNVWQITLDSSIRFAEHSPTKRIYFVEQPVSYCVRNEELWRHSGNYVTDANGIATTNGVLMAQHVQEGAAPFSVAEASHQRNAIVQVKLVFERIDETVTFNNEIQVMNVP